MVIIQAVSSFKEVFMKKIILFFAIFFWSMLFPNIAFHPFNTSITSSQLSYSDLHDSTIRKEVLQNATFDLAIKDFFLKK